MPDALKNLRNVNVNIGTLVAFIGGIGAIFAASYSVLVGLDSRIDDRVDSRVTPIERRLAEMQETIRENEGRRNAQYGVIINTLEDIRERR